MRKTWKKVIRSWPVRVGAVEAGPSGDRQAWHVLDLRQGELVALGEWMGLGEDRDLSLGAEDLGGEALEVVAAAPELGPAPPPAFADGERVGPLPLVVEVVPGVDPVVVRDTLEALR